MGFEQVYEYDRERVAEHPETQAGGVERTFAQRAARPVQVGHTAQEDAQGQQRQSQHVKLMGLELQAGYAARPQIIQPACSANKVRKEFRMSGESSTIRIRIT